MLAHAGDPRPYAYDHEAFAEARTHDPIWNAAQRQLVRTGVIHNYLRMLWAKKVLHWSRDPREALAVLLELNNRYALDGFDPIATRGFSGVWAATTAWGPEQPVFGKIRYMTSASTARKLRWAGCLRTYGAQLLLMG